MALRVLMVLGCCSALLAPLAPSTVVSRVTVLDGTGSAAIRNATVVITNGNIVSVRTGHESLPAGAQALDGHGGYLLPGFIDMHAHLLFPRCAPGPDGSVFDRPVSERMLAALLDFGITTVRSPATPTVSGLSLIHI